MKANRLLIRSAILVPLLLLISGCHALVEVFDCGGYVEHGYDIPDVVLVANAEQYVRDLEARPRVFYQTEGERLFFDAESSNYDVADAFTDEYGFLTVVAGRPGEARVFVEAHDSCGGRASTSFHVEVVRYASGGPAHRK
jgi:hypothetical protein